MRAFTCALSFRESAIRKQRVLFVNRFYWPDESATSVMLTDLLAGLDTSILDIRVLTGKSYYTADLGALPKREKRGDVNIRRISSLRVFNGSMAGRIVNYLVFYLAAALHILRHARRGDIVVCLTDPPLLNIVLFLPIVIKRARLVNWVQDIYPEVAIALNFGGPLQRLGSRLAPLRDFVWQRSVMNVVIGDRMREFVESSGVDPDRICVIPNWCDETKLLPHPDRGRTIRENWGLSDEDFVVMYSGNLGRAHDIDTILAAMKALSDTGAEHIKFVFVGGGAQFKALRKAVDALGITKARFFSYQSKSKLAQSLCVGDVHWISLRPALEGLIVPSKLFGVCAVARPSVFIGSAEGEIAKIQNEGNFGWHVDEGDGAGLAELVRAMSANPECAAEAGQRARAMVEGRFARNRSLDAWQALISSVSIVHIERVGNSDARDDVSGDKNPEPAE